MVKFIAEICSNYHVDGKNSKRRAMDLIDAAKRNGANAVKFQYFRGNMLYNKNIAPDTVKQLNRIQLPDEWLPDLKSKCDELKLEFMCSVFHPEHVEFIDQYVDTHKIASWELTSEPHINPLLTKVSHMQKPIIMSTAGASFDDINHCVNILIDDPDGIDMHDLTLMHCDPGYPISINEAQLRRLLDLGEEFFPVQVGYSSHLVHPVIVASSVLYFAKFIEVHFDLDDKKGLESGHSFSPKQFQEMVKLARQLELSIDGKPTQATNSVNMYRKNPTDWLRPLERE